MPLNVCANLTAPALALAPSSPKLQPLNRSKKEEGTREDRRPKRKAAHVTFISIPLVERAALIKTYTLSPIYFCFVNKERETNYCLVLGDTSIGSLHLLFYLHTAVEREETKHKVWTSRAQLHGSGQSRVYDPSISTQAKERRQIRPRKADSTSDTRFTGPEVSTPTVFSSWGSLPGNLVFVTSHASRIPRESFSFFFLSPFFLSIWPPLF